ncbi:MAG: hypothetical protein HY687_05755 [Chloroflexi bacterium]|nr:hypothetical protein [Chloroflexota bacterium]
MSGAKEAMHSLTREIIGACEARATGIATIKREVSTQKQATAAQLQELEKAHQALARKQRAELARGRAALTQTEQQRKARVHGLMKEIAQEHAGARAEWQGLGRTLRARRNGGGAVTPPPAPGAEGAEELASKIKGRRGNGGAKPSGQTARVPVGARA